MLLIPLKLKHRNPNARILRRAGVDPPDGTMTFSGGKHKAVSSNAGMKGKRITAGHGVRRRAYGPF